MNPDHGIEISRWLATGVVSGRLGRPRQADLRRAVSNAYYAMFHTLARSCADSIAGATPATRDQAAWERTYRALEHGYAKNQCLNRSAMEDFPEDVRYFGEMFVTMQGQRHLADYHPTANFTRSEVVGRIDEVEDAITRFRSLPMSDLRRFAIYVLLRNR